MTKNVNSNKPTHIAYQVENFESNGEQKSNWTQIGSAWSHPDNKGFNIKLKSFPLDGIITIREVKDISSDSDLT